MGGTIIACSKREYEIILKEITKGNTKRLACISNGIDLSQITMKDYSVINDKVKVGVLGRISTQKAPHVFAAIAATVLSHRQDVEFFWVGNGESEDEAMLAEAGVTVTGFLSRADAVKVLSSLDIFLQTSLYEGLSLALLEAQAAGIPAVVTNIPGNDEVVQHDLCGFVGNDEAELTTYLERLIDSSALRQQLGLGAREYVNKQFSFDAMGDQYKALYQEISENYPTAPVATSR
jgi:glycosyltransferase involved in cell wall biosynthesis